MPYSNIIPVTVAGLESVLAYLVDENHSHHTEYELTPLTLMGIQTPQDFVLRATAAFCANRRCARGMRVGPRPKYAVNWIVVRMPDQTWLSQQECDAYEKAACEEAGHGEFVVGAKNWHKNKLTGASDLNLLSASFSVEGELLRDRNLHPIASLRRHMDRVTEDLNHLRRQRCMAPIQTMQVAQARTRKQLEIFVIEDELARMPRPPRKATDLVHALLSIGCEVPRVDLTGDIISITKPRGKKSRRFSILKILEAVELRLYRGRKILPAANLHSLGSQDSMHEL